MDPVVLNSARKHGIEDEDMFYAYWNPIRVFDSGDFVMLTGADQNGRLLEIGVGEGDGVEFIVHAMRARSMPARSRFLR